MSSFVVGPHLGKHSRIAERFERALKLVGEVDFADGAIAESDGQIRGQARCDVDGLQQTSIVVDTGVRHRLGDQGLGLFRE